jgi:hypothetical protein
MSYHVDCPVCVSNKEFLSRHYSRIVRYDIKNNPSHLDVIKAHAIASAHNAFAAHPELREAR